MTGWLDTRGIDHDTVTLEAAAARARLAELPDTDGPTRDEYADETYAISVELTGSRCGPMFESVRVLVNGSRHTPEQLRAMCAEHYAIPLHQVGDAVPMSADRFDAEDEAWREREHLARWHDDGGTLPPGVTRADFLDGIPAERDGGDEAF